MCGLACIYPSKSTKTVASMLQKISHRGPDATGICVRDKAILGHRRLSIIDPFNGHQPMDGNSHATTIVFNGEIYNYHNLKNNIGDSSFQTNCDTEVVVRLYEKEGANCVKSLDGMYAFIIKEPNGLFAARDPLGIKPLYVGKCNQSLAFASELKAFSDDITSIQEFPAGYVYHSTSGLQRMFEFPVPDSSLNDEKIAEYQLASILTRSVTKRMISDVPWGVFLSGGLDSSIIAAISMISKPNLKTFSVGVKKSNDVKMAHRVARFLGSEHHHIDVDEEMLIEALPKVIYHLESFDVSLVRSACANWFLAKLASQWVKMVLTGEGADELFAGYDYLKNIPAIQRLDELTKITKALHNTNLQRVDRMTMAHGLEARVPFLDIEMVKLAFSMPDELKVSNNGIEKYILRKAFSNLLPKWVINRPKEKFAKGCGVADILSGYADKQISDNEYLHAINELPVTIRNKEELLYYRLWEQFYHPDLVRLVGRSQSV